MLHLRPDGQSHSSMKKFVFALLLIAASLHLSSQSYVDIARFSYANSPFNSFDNSDEDNQLQEYSLSLTLPVKLNDSLALITGIFGELINTRLNPKANYEQLYTLNPRIGLNIIHNKKWRSNLILLPKISSHLDENLSGDDVQIGAVAIISYAKNKNLSYKFGGYYNSEIFSPFFVPIVGLYYLSPSGKYEANFNLPISAMANMAVSKKLRWGLEFNGIVRTYNMPYRPDVGETYVEKSSNEIYTTLQWKAAKNFLLLAQAGYSIARYYRQYSDDAKIDFGLSAFRFGDNREALNTDFSDGLLLKASLIYRFYL